MKKITLLVAALLPLTVLAQTREAGPWWPNAEWGPADQAGASNRITPEKIVQAMTLVKTGKTYEVGQVYERGMPLGAHDARDVENMIDLPSGDQPCTLSAPGCHVSRFGSPPSAGTTYTSVLPEYSPLNAIHFPSGEKCGLVVSPWKLVRRRATPPARSTLQMLLA